MKKQSGSWKQRGALNGDWLKLALLQMIRKQKGNMIEWWNVFDMDPVVSHFTCTKLLSYRCDMKDHPVLADGQATCRVDEDLRCTHFGEKENLVNFMIVAWNLYGQILVNKSSYM